MTGIAGFFAFRTLRSINRQTSTIRDSIDLQKVPLKQWVDITNWKGGNALTTGEIERRWLETYFDIINPSNHPLMLKRINVTAKGDVSGQSIQHLITPKNKYSSSFIIQLTPDEAKQFMATNGKPLVFAVIGHVAFTDILGDDVVQPFRFLASYKYGSSVKIDYKWV